MRFLQILAAGALLAPAFLYAQSGQSKECGLSSLGTCVVHIAQDQWGIITSPTRVRANDLLWIAPFGVATGIALDKDVEAMQTLGIDPSREDKFNKISNFTLYGAAGSIGVGYIAGNVTHNDYLRQTSVLSAEAMVNAIILSEGLKYATNRERPNQDDGKGRFWPHGTKTWPDGQSMPSEHAMAMWAFAHVVAAQYNGIATKLIVYSLATTVSASRVMARQHFPSDVVVGSTFGYLIGGYVVHHRSSAASNFTLSPISSPNGRGIELAYNFAH
ncbi:MAG TPA: phosphatase PAP2 family protein [Silvibacterium sp.]|jgi:membrane-associated phospholipid phosphatase|nr:phosphatase PAP2 family protein [Silvibacterium sp.]